MKEYIKSVLWMFAGAMIMFVFRQVGVAVGPAAWAGLVFWLSVAALIAAYALSVVQIMRDGKADAPDVVAEREKAVRRQEEIVRDSSAEKAAIAQLGHRVWLVWTGMIALHALIGLSAGAAGGNFAAILSCLMGAFFLAPLLGFVLCSPKMVSPAPGTELCEDDFPELFSLAREVAQEEGHGRRIRMFIGEQGIGVFRAQNFDGMLLPSLLVRSMTKSELRQVMRHEFSHLVCEETKDEYRWLTLIARMDEVADACAFCFFGMLVLLPALGAFRERVTQYRTLIERKLETEADSRVLSPEEARDAVAAIAKSALFVRFCEEDRVSAYRCFEPEKPPENQVDIRFAVFEDMLAERGKMWLEELESEQSAQFDSHPTFSQRREIYGVTDCDAFSRENDSAWLAEMRRLCDLENAYLAGNPEYEAMRDHQYVNRRAAMEAYEKCADPLEELEPRKIVDAAEAYFGLDTPKAIGIVRSLMEKDPQNIEPKLLLGVWLLDARDDEGLELLYQVAENGNYTERALQEAGDYVFRRGNADQIAEYRRRSAVLLQSAAEFHYRLDDFSMKELGPRTMSDGLLGELVNEMLRIGGDSVSAIACAAKAFHPGEDAHVFVIEYADDDEERCEQIGIRIFELLDRREEYYSMRDGSEFPLKKLEKQIPGCIVYKKKDR